MNKKPTLVIMAAGMGSRYGGLKQIDSIGLNGEIIMDYSIYDARLAGFGKIVFVIKEEFYQVFKEKIGDRISKLEDIEVRYVFQDINSIPDGYRVPEERVKPWGTGHAVLSCKDVIDEPFAVINADDFYGSTTFKLIHDELVNQKNEYGYSMVGFQLDKTISENGSVARGICTLDTEGNLVSVEEKTKIEEISGRIYSLEEKCSSKEDRADLVKVELEGSTPVSMNIWGFMPSIFRELESGFEKFLEENIEDLKAEFYIPSLVDDLIKSGKAVVRVLETQEKWHGVTYQKDKVGVAEALKNMTPDIYPDRYINS
ncbi:nucleotidyltransferase [Propionigenium maris DSM 9537]|uniref:Nucleotidyltransferase n=1 Tax=Propionigenium maris DSM 9537 TaxID=1123000 RepID=A0A9W6GMG8_9FUSO|nr:sugar phosphate nucleotidyltransferase [Propionigenium maris]GLI56277.1 nucleotidyltransferase [Propionigenium maris DSM 9537]